MQIDEAALSKQFRNVWTLVGAANMTTDVLWETILKSYSEPHRAYHNLQHIVEMLDLLDKASTSDDLVITAEGLATLRLAVWFHDIVYQTQCHNPGLTNEELSAAWASMQLATVHAGPYYQRVVPRLIRTTAIAAEPYENDPLADVLHDLDYAILGASDVRAMTYDAGIRAEWQHVPEADYYAARFAFLRRLKEQPRIYRTDHFHNKLDAPARENLETILDIYRAVIK